MNKKEAKEIFNRSKNNVIKLNSCSLHDFRELEDGEIDISLVPYQSRKMGKRYKCLECDGVVDDSAKRWYDKGLVDGLKLQKWANDINA
jgi:hypothetical protein